MSDEQDSGATRPLPGTGALGQGFDIFGRYDDSAFKAPLFDLSRIQSTVDLSWGTFGKPYNVHVNESINPGRGSTSAYMTASDFTEKLKVKASVSAKYYAFSGAFSAAFGMEHHEAERHSFASYDYEKTLMSLQITDASAQNLASYVLDDPVFQQVPETFSPENAHLFFRFFKKYGTHFVRSVDVGARMNYNVAVSKSFTSDEVDLKARISAEVNAVFTGKASASADWNKAGKEWTQQREVNISVLGGENRKLAALRPGYEDDYKEVFSDWIDSLDKVPATTNFRLSPVEELFEGARVEEVRRAALLYAGSDIRVVSHKTTRDSLIMLNQKELVPDKEVVCGIRASSQRNSLIRLAVIDAKTLQPVLCRDYVIGWEKGGVHEFSQIAKDFEPYAGSDAHIAAFCFTATDKEDSGPYGYNTYAFPTGPFYGQLLGCGAGKEFERWEKNQHVASGYSASVNYALVGVCGGKRGSGIEAVGHDDHSYDGVRVDTLAFLRAVGMGEQGVVFQPEPV